MGWLGKVIGGTIGFALGGPLGAVAGAVFGHAFDSNGPTYLQGGRGSLSQGEEAQMAFFLGAFSMLAKLAQADGRVSEEEMDSSEHFMVHDNNAPVPHIGKYGNTWADLDDLLEQQEMGLLTPNAIHTAVIFVRQASLTGPDYIDDFEDEVHNVI